LRNKFNLFFTFLILGAYWAFWHVPLSTIKDYYQANLVESGWIYSLNFMASIIPYVLIMNWLYHKAKRNIILPVVFHITAVYFNEIFATHPDSKIIQTILLLFLAAFLIVKDRDFFFRKDPIPAQSRIKVTGKHSAAGSWQKEEENLRRFTYRLHIPGHSECWKITDSQGLVRWEYTIQHTVSPEIKCQTPSLNFTSRF
jgi:hypothetical protein